MSHRLYAWNNCHSGDTILMIDGLWRACRSAALSMRLKDALEASARHEARAKGTAQALYKLALMLVGSTKTHSSQRRGR